MGDSLIEALHARSPDDPLLRFPWGEFTVGETLSGVRDWRERWESLFQRSVCLEERASADMVLALLVLDGWVSVLELGTVSGSSNSGGLALEEFSRFWRCREDPRFGERKSGDLRALTGCGVKTEWRIPTSGTISSRGELVSHSLASLSRTVRRDPGKGKALIWGLLYEPSRFAGIQVILQALLGHSVLAVPDEPRNLEETLHFFARAKVNALSATPSRWRRLLMCAGMCQLQLKQITLGGEPVDDGLLGELQDRFPGASITQIYALTEQGVCFSVEGPRAGFPKRYLDEGTPQGRKLRLGEDGQLWVLDEARGQWFATKDLVECDEGWCRFVGRMDGQINVGGVKVRPEEVERVLLGVDGVAMALARGRRNAITGEVVEALVVPREKEEGIEPLRARLMEACRAKLSRHAVPVRIEFVEDLPLTRAGKLDRCVVRRSREDHPGGSRSA